MAPSVPRTASTIPFSDGSDPLDRCRGLALGLAISLLLWGATFAAAWRLWPG